MRIIISPAKKMKTEDSLPVRDTPVFLSEAEELKQAVQGLDYAAAKALWGCNDKIAALNYRRFAEMDLQRGLTPAILSYEGIQYQYMAPRVMDEKALRYLQKHLRILSGFYGVLKPFDGIVPYRLEMQAKLKTANSDDLYAFWGEKLYRELMSGETVLLDLASKEYSRCAEMYLKPEIRRICCVFGEEKEGRTVQKATLAKMARGEMVRFLAERQAEKPEEAKEFDRLGFSFCEGQSEENSYVFLRSSGGK